MIIKKLQVKGANKTAAEISFQKGLNVIAGASDTGKSYICDCFKFIFGAQNSPKSIQQSEGYSSLEIMFENSDGSQFTLKRELKNNSDITLEEVGENVTSILKPSHVGKENLSSYLLKKIGLDNKFLVSGTTSLNHATLTLRVLERIFLVDEKRIVSDESPLGTGNYMEKTLESSLLKTLITGSDDSAVKNLKKRKKSKGQLNQRIENLQDFLSRYFEEEGENSDTKEELEETLNKLDKSIASREAELYEIIGSNKALIEQKNELTSRIHKIDQMLDDDKTVLERFTLLFEKYSSDRERIEANSEAAMHVNDHYLAICPICDNESMDLSDFNVELIQESNLAEISRIDTKIIDLKSTISEIRHHKELLDLEVDDCRLDLASVDKLLDSKVSEEIKKFNAKLKRLNNKRIEINSLLESKEKREKILSELGELTLEFNEIVDTYEIPNHDSELEELLEEVSRVLIRWGFPGSGSVTFDSDKRDLVIGGKPRGHFGKGYRAICHAGFIIALMSYLTKKERHPGFVILDSPLTTYKKRDESIAISDEDEQSHISNNFIYAFYRDLCDFYNDQQIIVFDNQEPDEDLKNGMHYVHFSQNIDIGRFGFFPS